MKQDHPILMKPAAAISSLLSLSPLLEQQVVLMIK
jgi:hypothetical protein